MEEMFDPETPLNPATTNKQQEQATKVASIQHEDDVVTENLVGVESNQTTMNTAGCSMIKTHKIKEKEHVVNSYSSLSNDQPRTKTLNGDSPKLKDKEDDEDKMHSIISKNNVDMSTGDRKRATMSACLAKSRGDPNKCFIIKADTGEICEVIDMSKESKPTSPSYLINMEEKQCRYKDCAFTSKFTCLLARHEQSHSEEKPFKCDECNYASSFPSDLESHNLKHIAVKPFKCDKCDYNCRLKSELKKHTLIHKGVQLFNCEDCDYFGSSYNLKNHHRIHHRKKTFRCNKCNYFSSFPWSLNKHKQLHTGQKPYL